MKKLLCLIGVFFAISLAFVSCKPVKVLADNSPSIKTLNPSPRKVQGDVNNLSGTTWVFDAEIVFTMNTTFNINFTSNSTNYSGLVLNYNDDRLFYHTTFVYDSELDYWINDNYRTIYITGGTDISNSILINWLDSQASLVVDESPEDVWIANNPVKGTVDLVNAFMTTEIIPGFKIYYIWLASLGILFLGIIIKLWVH